MRRKSIFKCSSIQDLFKHFAKTPDMLAALATGQSADSQGLYHDFLRAVSRSLECVPGPIEVTEKQKEEVKRCVRKYALLKLYSQ